MTDNSSDSPPHPPPDAPPHAPRRSPAPGSDQHPSASGNSDQRPSGRGNPDQRPSGRGNPDQRPSGRGDSPDADARAALDRLIRTAGEGYAAVSRLLGRNPAYVQQYIKRGVPRRLDEEDRRTLARHFAVSEELLGGPPRASVRITPEPAAARTGVAVPQLRQPPGAPAKLVIDPILLATSADASVDWLVAYRMDDDSMRPTLVEGDLLLIDTADRQNRLRDGLYALANGDRIFIKRLSVNPVTLRVTILSDSAAYAPVADCAAAEIQIIGRVVWYGRNL